MSQTEALLKLAKELEGMPRERVGIASTRQLREFWKYQALYGAG
jgi:hypothetical protein